MLSAIRNSSSKVLEQDDTNAASENCAPRIGIERTAVTVGRQDAAFNAHITGPLRNYYR